MIFEWDEEKNGKNIAKHQLSFEAVREFAWHGAVVFDRTRAKDGEQRFAAVGLLGEKLHTVIFTRRGLYTRVISLRRSNEQEEEGYGKTSSRYADDAPLTKKELATGRPLRDVFPDLAAYSRSRARKGEAVKKAVSIRLPPDVITFFKSKGPGWQTRISHVLRVFVEVAR